MNKLEAQILINDLKLRIKELESEKELSYQQGKSDAVDILLENCSPDGDLTVLTKTVRYGDEYEEAWDAEKLNNFFKINQSITGVHQEFSEMLECLYWNAVAIKDGYTDELYSPHSINETEVKLKEFIDCKINEIKAQGIEEAINQVAIDCMYDEDPVIVLTRVSNYADKLRTNHD